MTEIKQKLAYGMPTLQSIFNARLNSAAVELLAESFGDDPTRFPLGGVLLVGQTHQRVPIYITVSRELPEIIGLEEGVFPEDDEAWQEVLETKNKPVAKVEMKVTLEDGAFTSLNFDYPNDQAALIGMSKLLSGHSGYDGPGIMDLLGPIVPQELQHLIGQEAT